MNFTINLIFEVTLKFNSLMLYQYLFEPKDLLILFTKHLEAKFNCPLYFINFDRGITYLMGAYSTKSWFIEAIFRMVWQGKMKKVILTS